MPIHGEHRPPVQTHARWRSPYPKAAIHTMHMPLLERKKKFPLRGVPASWRPMWCQDASPNASRLALICTCCGSDSDSRLRASPDSGCCPCTGLRLAGRAALLACVLAFPVLASGAEPAPPAPGGAALPMPCPLDGCGCTCRICDSCDCACSWTGGWAQEAPMFAASGGAVLVEAPASRPAQHLVCWDYLLNVR